MERGFQSLLLTGKYGVRIQQTEVLRTEEKLKRLKNEHSTELFNFIPTTAFSQLPEQRSVEHVNQEKKRLKQKFSPVETTANQHMLESTLTNFPLTANYFAPAPMQQLQPLRLPLPPPANLSYIEQACRRRHTLGDKTRSLQNLLPVDKKMDMAKIYEETHKSVMCSNVSAPATAIQAML
ncbi:hypothetical protein L1987_06220 [Smallanthus sonchifolius]|uniref:Uncharacterized protein n=1 Tax=Smallanthus sonchifolius TaxID=185202 RepID=A0ACB9JXW7_9ASTR|nr:hypothetical protein L1987_06220 [Smallanthus sonchifolius]